MSTTLDDVAEALREALGADAVKDGDSERDLHSADLSFHEPHRPDLVVYPSSTADVSQVLAIANERRIPVTPFGVGTSLEGHIIPIHGGITPRPLAARPHRRPIAGEPDRNRAGGRHPPRADARCGRARPLLPRRPRRRRDARRHGRDERRRHDHRSLRQDARQRARARGRPGRRAHHPHGNAGRQVVRGLRPHRAARRLGGNARRDHRGDGQAPRDPGARRRAADLVPRHRERLQDRRLDRRRGRRRHADRVPRRLVRRRRQRLLGDVVSRRPLPLRRGGGQRGARRTPTSSSSRRSPRRRARPRSSTSATPTPARGCGRPATMQRTQRPTTFPGRRSGQRTCACR